MKKILLFIILCAIGLVAISSCSSTLGKLKNIQDNGEIIVYTTPNFPPFEFPGTDGIEGVDIELAKAIAAELGAEVKIEETEFDSIIMALKGGKGDIGIAGITITDSRKESVDFSDPYIESFQYMILLEDSAIEVMENLAGKNIGVAHGYTGHFVIEYEIDEEEGGVLAGTGAALKEYKSAMDATLDLTAGRIDAVVMDEYVAKTIVANNSGLKAIPLKYQDGSVVTEEYGVTVAKGNEDLLEIINKVITQLKSEDKINEWLVNFSEQIANQ